MPVIDIGRAPLNLNASYHAQSVNRLSHGIRRGNPADNISIHRGLKGIMKMPDIGVSVITCVHRSNYINRVFENYITQEYPYKELIIVLNNDNLSSVEWETKASLYPGIRVFRLPEGTSLGTCYNFGIEQSRYDYLAKFDDDDYYAPQYLLSSMMAFRKIDADIIGKNARYVYFESLSALALMAPLGENVSVPYVVGATLIFKKVVWSQVRFRDITSGEDSEFQSDCLDRGYKIFSIDRFNYVTIRHPDTVEHTFVIDDLSYFALGELVARTDDFRPLVIKNQAYFL
ncbi:MAG: glycosyltransferase family 2 protein [Syntrophomonadaceae bacterium]|nr:glycosyltransferase family 2 protein [Syntrophomonadaceae bacterium]